jgi:hypothetical protein
VLGAVHSSCWHCHTRESTVSPGALIGRESKILSDVEILKKKKRKEKRDPFLFHPHVRTSLRRDLWRIIIQKRAGKLDLLCRRCIELDPFQWHRWHPYCTHFLILFYPNDSKSEMYTDDVVDVRHWRYQDCVVNSAPSPSQKMWRVLDDPRAEEKNTQNKSDGINYISNWERMKQPGNPFNRRRVSIVNCCTCVIFALSLHIDYVAALCI